MGRTATKKVVKPNRCIGPGPKRNGDGGCPTMLPKGSHICETCQKRIKDLRIGENLEVLRTPPSRSYFSE